MIDHRHTWLIATPAGAYSWGHCLECDVQPRQFCNIAEVDFSPRWVRNKNGLEAMNRDKKTNKGR